MLKITKTSLILCFSLVILLHNAFLLIHNDFFDDLKTILVTIKSTEFFSILHFCAVELN